MSEWIVSAIIVIFISISMISIGDSIECEFYYFKDLELTHKLTRIWTYVVITLLGIGVFIGLTAAVHYMLFVD